MGFWPRTVKHPQNHPKNPKKPLFLAIFGPFLAIFSHFLPKFSAHFFFQNWAKAHFFWPQTDQTGLVRTNLTNSAHFFWPLPTFLPTFLDKTGRGFWTFFSHFRPNLDKKKRDCESLIFIRLLILQQFFCCKSHVNNLHIISYCFV